MYGIASESIVSREDNIKVIIDSFTEQKNMYTYLITGLRGSGKTVLLREIEEYFSKNNNWIVININPQGDLLKSLASRLYDLGLNEKILGKISLSIKLGIITLTRENGESVTDPEIIIEHFLQKYKEKGIRILLSIDEVNDTDEFRKFINFYQVVISKAYPLYLLMTALQENINSLINDKAMTFLSRAPKIVLQPLPLTNIALNYKEIFNINDNEAVKMAKLTNGYAFAYQVLGYLFYEAKLTKLNDKILQSYDKYLWNNGYSKFWQDSTGVEKEFLIALAKCDGQKDNIISQGFSSSNYSKYRQRLLEKGLVYMPRQKYLAFVLPRFKEYVLFMAAFEE